MKQLCHIVFTSDTHGHIFPVNYGTAQSQDSGLLNLAGRLQAMWAGETEPDFPGQTEENTLVIDGGDSLQGSPLVQYYLSNAALYDRHPVAEAFSAVGCQFYTLGNHDFNFGREVLSSYLHRMKAQCVCANVHDRRGELPLTDYMIVPMPRGLKVGICGVVTDWVNIWEEAAHLEDLEVTDPLEEAERVWREKLRGRCDLSICIYHGGFEEDLTTGRKLSDTTENLACRLMREGHFDILLTGHQHMAVPAFQLCGTHAVQPPDKAQVYCAVRAEREVPDSADGHGGQRPENLRMSAGGNRETAAVDGEDVGRGRWQISSRLVQVGNRTDRKTMDALMAIEQGTQKWLDEPIGFFREALTPEKKIDCAIHGSAVAALFNAVQLEATGADFSCTSLGNDPIGFPQEVTMRHITAAYPFANTIMVLEVTADTIRKSLERVASYYDLQDGRIVISQRFLKPKVEHYNYDFYANLAVTFDIRKPLGSRVMEVKMLDGRPLQDDRTYTLVTSNYRATGTGGYPEIGASRVIRSTTEEMPDLLADYIRRHSPLERIHNAGLTVLGERG